ncbi:hypothetical protein [Azospirillum doebereinerae]
MHDSPSETDAFLLLGQVVFEMQETESTLHLSMSVIFGLPIAKSLEHLKKIYEKKTLGQFLALTREKIGVNPSFDKYMKDYIERRNFAIHNISRASDFDVYSSEGRAKFLNFLTDLRYRNRKINLTFIALTEFFMRKYDPKWATSERIQEILSSSLFKEIEEEFIPRLGEVFTGNNRESKKLDEPMNSL